MIRLKSSKAACARTHGHLDRREVDARNVARKRKTTSAENLWGGEKINQICNTYSFASPMVYLPIEADAAFFASLYLA